MPERFIHIAKLAVEQRPLERGQRRPVPGSSNDERVTSEMNRYPERDTVSMYRGDCAVSARALRSPET
jgi:hypothetical protein